MHRRNIAAVPSVHGYANVCLLSPNPEVHHDIQLTRDNGSKQWAAKGKPVYYWVKDSKPGDKTGDSFNKVWKVAKP